MAGRAKKNDKKSTTGRLRIVAGKWRSRLLEIAAVPGLRPTPERVRETLFNWLTPHIAGARCLDLFAGTGALGLEALSRGAAETVFVERSRTAVNALRRNIAELNATGAIVHELDAIGYLHGGEPGAFDIVFLDPPFGADLTEDLCRLLDAGSLLAADARVYIEQDRSKPEPEWPEGWQMLKTKTAGNVRYSLVRAAGSVEE